MRAWLCKFPAVIEGVWYENAPDREVSLPQDFVCVMQLLRVGMRGSVPASVVASECV